MEILIISKKMHPYLLGRALYPFIQVNSRIVRHKKLYKRVLNHERIHHAQQKELLVIPFLIWYYLEFFYYFLSTGDLYRSYMSIRFEKECYKHEKDMTYLSRRKPYNYLKSSTKKR